MLLTRSVIASTAVTWVEAKPYLKAHDADQILVESIIKTATLYAETFTGRATGANEWTMLRDDFLEDDGCPMRIPLADVASVVSIKRTVSNTPVLVASSVYQLRPYLSEAFIVERAGQAWPSDADDVAHAVEVIVQQAARVPADLWRGGILRHVAALWADRGDAEAAMLAGAPDGWTRTALQDSAKQSGAEALYAGFRIPEL